MSKEAQADQPPSSCRSARASPTIPTYTLKNLVGNTARVTAAHVGVHRPKSGPAAALAVLNVRRNEHTGSFFSGVDKGRLFQRPIPAEENLFLFPFPAGCISCGFRSVERRGSLPALEAHRAPERTGQNGASTHHARFVLTPKALMPKQPESSSCRFTGSGVIWRWPI